MKHTLIALTTTAAALVACGSGKATSTPTAAPLTGVHQRQVQSVIDTDHSPSGLVVGHDAIFVGNHRGGTVQRIDPTTNRVTGTVAVGGQLELENTTGVGGRASLDERTTSLWACSNADGVLHQVDPRAMTVTANVPARCDGGWRTRVGQALWAVPGGDARDLLILDTRTAKLLHRIPLGDAGYGWGPAVEAAGNVIVGSGNATPVLTTSGRILRRTKVVTPWLVSAGGHLYVIHSDGRTEQIDPTTLAVVHTYALPPHGNSDPQLVGDGSGHLFYRPDSTHLYTVDLGDGKVTPLLELPYSEAITTIAWGFGSLWVTNFDADTVWRLNPAA
jgi:hypothetical protein